MVSAAFTQIENKTAEAQSLYAEFVGEIAYKAGKESPQVAHALSMACVTTGCQPIEMAHHVNEFLVFLREGTQPEAPEQAEDSPYMMREEG
jgi:hypothetical protein